MKRIDTLIVNGDHSVDHRGIPVTLTGERELIQRALFRLTVRKGSFQEDPSFGSELFKLGGIIGGDLARMAQSYAQEALLPMPEVGVSGVSLERRGELLRLHISLSIAQNQYQLEVDIQ